MASHTPGAPVFAPAAELPDWALRSVDLANPRLGAKALTASDDFFAEVGRMLNPEPAQFVPGKFDTNGKWMDGWESRSKRVAGHDWALVRLGVKGVIRGFDVDTSHFTGNYPPAVSIEACVSETDDVEALQAATWTEILPATPDGPQQPPPPRVRQHRGVDPPAREHVPGRRHRPPTRVWPPGEHARGHGPPAASSSIWWRWRTAAARCRGTTPASAPRPPPCCCPGRGMNMGDGWETRRRREPGNDWCVLELGAPGTVERIEVEHRLLQGQLPRPLLAAGGLCDRRHRPLDHHPVDVLADPAARAEAGDGRDPHLHRAGRQARADHPRALQHLPRRRRLAPAPVGQGRGEVGPAAAALAPSPWQRAWRRLSAAAGGAQERRARPLSARSSDHPPPTPFTESPAMSTDSPPPARRPAAHPRGLRPLRRGRRGQRRGPPLHHQRRQHRALPRPRQHRARPRRARDRLHLPRPAAHACPSPCR